MRSLAAGAIIVGIVSVAAALTLLPAMLGLSATAQRAAHAAWARTSAARRRVQADLAGGRQRVPQPPAGSLALAPGMIALAVPVLGLHIGASGVATLPGPVPSKQGYLVMDATSRPSPYPVEIVAGAPGTRADLSKLETVLAADPRFGSGAIRASAWSIQTLTVPIRGDAVLAQNVTAVRDLRQRLIPAALAGSDARVLVGGQTAVTADYFHAVTAPTPYVLAFVLGSASCSCWWHSGR